jgi:hypothetical protein
VCKCYKNEKFNKKKQDGTRNSLNKLMKISRILRDNETEDYSIIDLIKSINEDNILNIDTDDEFLYSISDYDYRPNNQLFVYLLYLIYFDLIDYATLEKDLTSIKDHDLHITDTWGFIVPDAGTLIKLVEEGILEELDKGDFLPYMNNLGFFS